VEISGAPGIEYSLDGAPFAPGTSLDITGTGVHSLDFQGSDRSHGSLAVPIDVSDPTVSVNPTYGFGSVAHPICADSGSGLASCSINPDPLDTGSAGPKTVHVRAVDRVGRMFEHDLSYTVTPYVFAGFFRPIDNLPAVNNQNAGSAVPVKFSLSGFRGLNLFAQNYPATQRMTCGGGVTGALEPTTANGFAYDPLIDEYNYTWKTLKSWSGTCRQLIVRFSDGTEKRANFRFQ
jgi:hypothetical protein